MASQEELVRMRRREIKKAIDLAMEGKWREAVEANKNLIANFRGDAYAFNRLGRAYLKLGEYREARGAYRKALEIDPYNLIAKKYVTRLSRITEAAVALGELPREDASHRVEPDTFIEETGKAGVVNLYRLASSQVLAAMVAGDKVELRAEGQNLIVGSGRGEYVGLVEPKHAQRLARLIYGGNRYRASLVSLSEDSVTIIIREEYQDASQLGMLSFLPKGLERVRSCVGERLRREFEWQGDEDETAGSDYREEKDVSPQDNAGGGEGEE